MAEDTILSLYENDKSAHIFVVLNPIIVWIYHCLQSNTFKIKLEFIFITIVPSLLILTALTISSCPVKVAIGLCFSLRSKILTF